MRRALLIAAMALAVFAALTFAGGPAEAAFNVCNKTDLSTRVALGRFDGKHWTSEGWWIVKPGTCAGLITGLLDSRYYYLYATDSAAGTWEGKTHFCVAPEARFQAPGRVDCARRGYDRRGFFEIDTGQAGDWTQSLSN